MSENAISCEECSGMTLIEQPNKELLTIKKIQALTTLISDNLDELPQSTLKAQAIEDIDLFERTTLFQLQKAVE